MDKAVVRDFPSTAPKPPLPLIPRSADAFSYGQINLCAPVTIL